MATALERARAAAVPDSILFGSGSRSSSNPFSRARRKTRSSGYRDYLEARYNAAEAATRGHLVNAEGRRRGISANQFFSGKTRSLKYASPELQDWFKAHGTNVSAARFRAQAVVSAPRAASRILARSSGS